MPVVPEETVSDVAMDEFINWDNAEPAVGAGAADQELPQVPLDSDPNLDLMFSNVNGDDFSFWALEHFANSANNLPTDDIIASLEPQQRAPELGKHSDSPCWHCSLRGYACKKIYEGKYKNYCTSCVALRVGCSWGFEMGQGAWPPGDNFPLNPWPVAGDHPNAIFPNMPHSSSAPDQSMAPPSSSAAADAAANPGPAPSSSQPPTPGPGKIGARLSKEAVRILKNWYSTHSRHPYPTDEEKESLQRLTGLSKLQINNWLANYRRRSKFAQPRSTSPSARSHSLVGSIEIPHRRGTPSPLESRGSTTYENMNPLQRWANSPPENEPASVTDIARAVSASSGMSSGLASPYSLPYTDDGSGRSLGHGSSASSLGTSHSSGGSFASAYSFGSRNSLGSLGSLGRGRRRRRRRPAAKAAAGTGLPSLSQPLKTFQCTFCTETFRTKHDWGRHEKSLHLSLERWVCCPKGAKAFNPETSEIQCVFCGETNPDEAHLDMHNFAPCQEKSRDERTFYRKDHLRQHLKLVHNAKFVPWSMTSWEESTAEIRSRCGFCGIVMDSWSFRVEHLAEHFKTGNTMADWKGDWGFDRPVLDMVQSAIPPYLIHEERLSPLPFTASLGSPESPVHAYDLIKYELMYWAGSLAETPSDDELQLEACRVIFGAEVLSHKDASSVPSWLRDLLMSNAEVAFRAQMGPIRGAADSRMARLTINGKNNIFENCPLESQLRDYVHTRTMLGLCATDSELQLEACKILGRIEESSGMPSEMVANLLIRLIKGSKSWLAPFRQRAHIPRSEEMADEDRRPLDGKSIDSTIHSYSRLETELADYVRTQRSLGLDPDDADLQRKARIIIYEYDDGWNQTAADSPEWLAGFKKRLAEAEADSSSGQSRSPLSATLATTSLGSEQQPPTPTILEGTGSDHTQTTAAATLSITAMDGLLGGGAMNPAGWGGGTRKLFLNDMNCYRRLEKELSRWVAGVMSPNNPNQHVPSDEELRHQARWILYDDDDPWNNTAADNAEWLRRFKRDNGILSDESGPGLPKCDAWSVQQGGTGFAPPYAYPRVSSASPSSLVATGTAATGAGPSATAYGDVIAAVGGGAGDGKVQIAVKDGAKLFETEQRTLDKFLRAVGTRYPRPATVFCSRELENGLAEYARAEMRAGGALPSDEALRAKAREILGTEITAADDVVLLEKFKAMIGGDNPENATSDNDSEVGRTPAAVAEGEAGFGGGGDEFASSLMPHEGLTGLSNSELDEMLFDVDFDGGAALVGSPSQLF